MTQLLSAAFDHTVSEASRLKTVRGSARGAIILLVDEADAFAMHTVADLADDAWKASAAEQLSSAIKAAFDGGDYVEAVKLEKSLAEKIETAETEREGKPGAQTAGALANLSWYALFARQYDEALAAAERAIALAPPNLVAATNRAHALMFLGREEEARAAYLENQNKTIDNAGSWSEVILADFAEFEKRGMSHPQMGKIRELLTSSTTATK